MDVLGALLILAGEATILWTPSLRSFDSTPQLLGLVFLRVMPVHTSFAGEYFGEKGTCEFMRLCLFFYTFF